ncbi:MAG: DUF2062 domain-containing protein [Deltaproteobacteria bacterium]|nr:DUF2062 domain-containing protein [Deltaproteobacteria bacterium]
MQIKRQLRYFYYRFIRMRSTPDEVARGMAVGIFVGMTPTFPFQTILALLLAMWLRESKIAAALGVWITNPFTSVPIFAFNYKVGRLFVSAPAVAFKAEHLTSMENLVKLGLDYFLVLMLGSIIVGVFSAIIAYFITKPLFVYAVHRHHQSRLARREKKAE